MLPGLVEECQSYLVKFGVTKPEAYSKLQWKNIVKENIALMNKSELLDMMKCYKKLDHKTFGSEKFELKPYFKKLNLTQARQKFQLRCFMTRTVKLNYPSDPRFARDLWTCWQFTKMDSQSHIVICEGYVMKASE